MELANCRALHMKEEYFLCVVVRVSMIIFARRVLTVHKIGKVLKLFEGNKIHIFAKK
jgi:hypothetical protein